MSDAKEYPEDWNQHEQAAQESERKIKLKDGQSVRVHILSGPLTYRELYIKTGVDEKGKDKKKRIALPFGAQLPGFKFKTQYLMEVVVLDGAGKGQHKLLAFGKQIADGLAEVKKVWGSTRIPDIVVSRTGSGQMDTEYKVTAAPATVKPESHPVEFNLETEVGYSSQEDINSLPKPTATAEGSVNTPISMAQVDLIDMLSKKKELTVAGLSAVMDRKFSKKEVSKLTMSEASSLIDTIQGM